MANVGTAPAGRTLIGTGVLSQSTFAPIGTSSGLTNHGVILGQGTGAFVATNAGTLGNVLTSNGSGADPSFQSISTSGAVISFTGDSGGAQTPTGAGNFNLLGSGSITTVGTANTETFQLTGLTNHAVLVGAGTSTITKVGPTATAGQILQSAGSSADPVFSTATYPSTAGTSGNVLTSDGTNWVSSAPASTFAPNAVLQLFDDFVFVQNDSGNTILQSSLQWKYTSNLVYLASAVQTAGRPGILANKAAGSGFIMSGYSDNVGGVSQLFPIKLGGGIITLNWVINVNTLSNVTNRYTLLCGLSDSISGGTAAVTNGVYFNYIDNVNSGNWVGNCTSASATTSANSSTTVSAGSWVNLQITINAAGTSVEFYVNGSQIANSPIATNIPTVSLAPFLAIAPSAGIPADSSILIDLFYMTQTLTSAR